MKDHTFQLKPEVIEFLNTLDVYFDREGIYYEMPFTLFATRDNPTVFQIKENPAKGIIGPGYLLQKGWTALSQPLVSLKGTQLIKSAPEGSFSHLAVLHEGSMVIILVVNSNIVSGVRYQGPIPKERFFDELSKELKL